MNTTAHKPIFLFTILILMGLLLTNSLFSIWIFNGIVFAKSTAFIFLSGFSVLALAAVFINIRRELCFSGLDLIVTSLFIYTICNNYFHRGNLFSIDNIENVCLLIIYILIKYFIIIWSTCTNKFIFIILMVFILQLMIAVGQWFHLIPTFNANFRITGIYFNPAPFAIYLAGLISYSFCFFKFNENKIIVITSFIAIIIAAPIELILFSRSAWISIIACTCFVMISQIQLKKKEAKFLRSSCFRFGFITLTLVIGILLYQLYLLKESSANGRILIWKISLRMFLNHPCFGIGQSGFSESFLKYQAAYFMNAPSKMATDGKLAGEVIYAFNDCFQFAIEQGIVGIILIFFVAIFLLKAIFNSFKTENYSKSEISLFRGASLCIVSLFISGLFSYPMSILPLKILFILSSGILSGFSIRFGLFRSLKRFDVKANVYQYFISLTCGIGFGLIFYSFCEYTVLKMCGNVNEKVKHSINNLEYFAWIGRNEMWFEFSEVEFLLANKNYNEAILKLENLKRFSSDTKIYYTLGWLYSSFGNFTKAESQYQFLYYALPDLVKPKYYLAKLYLETKKIEKWKKLAEEIIYFEPKIKSNFSDQMKLEIKDLYYNKN